MTSTTTHSPTPWSYEYNPYRVRRGQDGIESELPAFEVFDDDGDKVFDTNEDTPAEQQEANAVIAVMASGNRDADRFPNPDTLDIARADNRHLAFGWAAHFCFGAPLARLEGQIMLETTLRRLPQLELESEDLTWRENLGLRGLNSLPVKFLSPEMAGQTIS